MTSSHFAFFFDEGAGYLFVKNIGTPCNGEVQLVRCIADGRFYVRKETYPIPLDPDAELTSCNEVRLYRPHPHIPRLIDWVDEFSYKVEGQHRSTASVWEFCNGGDLSEFLAKGLRRGIPIPEVFLWKLLYQIGTVLDFIHFGCQPSIGHGDFHAGNIFLHWEDDSTVVPEIKLGDFGNAHCYNLIDAGSDFSSLNELMVNITIQSKPRRSTPYSQLVMDAIEGTRQFYAQWGSFYRDSLLHAVDQRQVRPYLTSLLELTKSQYQHALASMSDQDREYILRLRPRIDTSVLMCDSPQALSDIDEETPEGLCKIVEVDTESLEIIRVVENASFGRLR